MQEYEVFSYIFMQIIPSIEYTKLCVWHKFFVHHYVMVWLKAELLCNICMQKWGIIINRKIVTPLVYILLITFIGFITGVLSIALWKENFFFGDGILEQKFIFKIQDVNMDKRALFFLCLGRRLRAFFLLFLLAYSSVNVLSNTLFFSLNGFYIGSVMELLAIRYGIQGLWIYMGMIFPQGIFYAFGFACLGCWCLNMEVRQEQGIRGKVKKIQNSIDWKKILLSLGAILLGIILESYVNVFFYKILIK